MSLSGSTSEPGNRAGDSMLRFNEAEGPGASAENPGGVFPQVDPKNMARQGGGMPGSGPPDRGGDARGVFSNPEMFKETFGKLHSALSDSIDKLDEEAHSGVGTVGKALKKRLEEMRDEIMGYMSGKDVPGAEGGEKMEDVERTDEGKETGLYRN